MLPWPRCRQTVALSLLVMLAASCGPGTVNSEDRAILSLAGAAEMTIAPGDSADLAWLLVRQSTGGEAGHTIVFTIVAAGDHGSSLAVPSGVTNDAGMASVNFTAGPEALALPIQVQGAVTSIPVSEPQPDPVSFTIHVQDPLRALRHEPPDRDRYEGLTGGRVALAVRATTGGARPLTNETITWEVTNGELGGARFNEATSLTDVTGIARANLECGAAPSTVTVRATMEGTAPVEFIVDVTEWGACDATHPCPRGWDCVDGACMEPTHECDDDSDCAGDERCRFGDCVTSAGGDGAPCKRDDECEEGETCVYGECTDCEVVACPCETVDDCPDGFICVDGVCVCPPDSPDCGGDPTCDVVDPDLAGMWDLDSILHIRESLPHWLDGMLDFLGPPFRFLSDGILGGFDFDIPIIGGTLEDAADSLVERYIPPWVGELMGAIADLNDILSTFHVFQEMDIWGAGMPDQYLGELGWNEVEMTWRGDVLRGRMEDITGLTVEHDDIEAEAICGTFYLHRHDVSVGFGFIVRWLLDVIVTAVTDGEYFTLEELLLDLVELCDGLATALDDLAYDLAESLDISLPDVYSLAYGACEAGVEAGTASAIDWLEGLTISGDAMTLGGHATISSPNNLDDGRWDGTLVGRDFSGEWTGRRR